MFVTLYDNDMIVILTATLTLSLNINYGCCWDFPTIKLWSFKETYKNRFGTSITRGPFWKSFRLV